MTTETTFRPATPADAAALAVLVDIAGEGLPNWLWRGLAGPGRSALEVGRERARREEGGFSYKHATVAETGGEIAASLVVYRLDDPYDLTGVGDLPAHVQPLVRLESLAPGSWYVNVLATFPEYRGRGIGSALLALGEDKARRAGSRVMSIIVGTWNEGAERLYRRLGYETTASERAILPPEFPQKGDWLLMLKSL